VLEAQARDLEIARRQAVEAGRAKDQFLAMLGHELRNPLAPILVTLRLMRMEGATSPGLDVVERQVRHLTRLVDDLLDVSRITRGMVTLSRQPLELASVVHGSLELAGPLLEQRGHRVLTELAHRGLTVSGDPDRLAQVVSNLITNAAKYSEAGSQIRIRGARAGDRVRLSVSDDGVGIAPEMLATIFEAFVQQQQTLARSHGGLGLGLAIARSLTEAHGGTLSVESEGLGKGSTFIVELPAIASASVATEAPPAAPLKRPVTPLRTLIVDDNHDIANAFGMALEASGFTVGIAYDGRSALEIADKLRPQLALIDIGLPGMDGYELAERLRAAHDARIVAISGYGQESDRRRSLEAGFAAHLVKPVDLDVLLDLASRLSD
jgi:CheY-like chemotaxis protein